MLEDSILQQHDILEKNKTANLIQENLCALRKYAVRHAKPSSEKETTFQIMSRLIDRNVENSMTLQ